MIAITVNPLYPNRIVVALGSLAGPLTSPNLGAFDPRRDLEVYIDGALLTLLSFSFDQVNNRYLLFAAKNFDTNAVVQVIHHMPASPFASAS